MTENIIKTAKTMPPIKAGCHNFNLTFKVPAGETDYVDKFFADHEAFMRATHAGPEEPFAQMYIVTKQAEQKDGAATGDTVYAVTETYQAIKGCHAHMAAGQGFNKKDGEPHGDLFARFLDVVGKYSTSAVMMAEVVHTMSNPLVGAMDAVKPGCHAFNICLKVPDSETSVVDKFFADHKGFMEESHLTSGEKEPCVLFYTIAKTAELKDSKDPSAGSTGNVLYALTEIYRGLEGCEAHMAAGKAYKQKEGEPHGALFATFLEVVEKYSTATIMMAPVVAAMHD